MIRLSFKTLFQIPKSQFNPAPTSLVNRLLTTSSSVRCLIDTFHLPSDAAIFISNKLKITENDEIDRLPEKEKLIQHCFSVFSVLKDHEFSGTQISRLIRKRPKTLGMKSVEALRARLKFLEEKGFERKDLGNFIATNPFVLDRAVEARLLPAWEFLSTCLGTDDKVRKALARWPFLLTGDLNNIVQPNVVLLMDHGVPLDAISKLIVSNPKTILSTPERMSRVIMDLKESGRDPGSKMFICALRVMVNISQSAWNKKLEALRSIGLSEEDVKFLVKNYPLCLACSVKKIRAAFDFLLNTIKLDLNLVVAQPLILMYGLEGRVRPRLNVVKVLKAKNLFKRKVNLNFIMTMSEKQFIAKFVVPNQKLVPDLMEVYRGSIPA